jgi:transcription antitermination factor NusG
MPDRDECGEAASHLHRGDRVRITAGTFEGFEAEVTSVDPASGNASAMLIVGFSIKPIELRGMKWQKIFEEASD